MVSPKQLHPTGMRSGQPGLRGAAVPGCVLCAPTFGGEAEEGPAASAPLGLH